MIYFNLFSQEPEIAHLVFNLTSKFHRIFFLDDSFLFCYLIWIDWFIVFNTIFSYIMTTSFSGGRSRSTRRGPMTMGEQLVNFITWSCESSAPFL